VKSIASSFSTLFGNLLFASPKSTFKSLPQSLAQPQQSAKVILLYGLKLEGPETYVLDTKFLLQKLVFACYKKILGSLPQAFSLFVFLLSLYFK